MNQEIEGKLRIILDKFDDEEFNTHEAIKAIQELVCSTVPDEPDFRLQEILKKWS